MSPEDQAVYFNAVPLLVVAAAYLFVAVALTATLWRERERVTAADLALASIFPCIGIPAAIFGALVLHDRAPIGGHVWPPFAASVIALVPALVFLFRRQQRANVLISNLRAREAEELVSVRDRELDSVAGLARSLARTQDPASAGHALLDEVESLLGVEFAALALIDAEGREARGLVAHASEGDIDWWSDLRLDLRNEPSGIANAYFDAAPVSVFDIGSSPLVSKRLATAVGAKSAAFIPLTVDERVIGVLVAASTRDRRVFSPEELRLMQTVAGEAAIALDRSRSVIALDEALARERLVAAISRRLRSTRDLEELTRIAVTETGRALGASRCFLRLGDPGETLPMRAEWWADGLKPIGDAAHRLPVSNLAARERRTIAIEDIQSAPELDDRKLGDRETLERLGSRAALGTPVVAFDRMMGVLGLHRTEPGPWTDGDVALAESVAHEIALSIHVTSLLEENERRLGEQSALLQAAQVVTSELELDAVLQRLVDEVAGLLQAEAVDCFLLDPERDVLRCAAVHGLPEEMIGFEFPSDRGLAGRAIARGRSALADDYSQVPEAVPHEAYDGFQSVIVAPMRWAGEVKGVLGVGTRESGRELTRAEGELLEAFANLAALALRNAESFEEHLRQARVQRGFYRIASALGQPVSLEETLDALAQAAAEALGGSSAAVLMPRNDDLRLAGLHSLAAPLVRFLEEGVGDPAGPLRSAARRRRVLAASNVLEDDRFGPDWQEVLDESGCRALLAAPVEAPRSEEAALVLVFFGEERRFADDDLELTRNLTGAARGALERSELFEAERRSRALAQQLARTSSLLAPDLDPAAVLEEVVRRAPELLSADAAVLRLLEGDELVVRAVGGVGAEALESRVPSTARLAGDAVQSRAPVSVADAREDNRLLQADPVLASGYSGYLAVPLIGPEAVHGVLSVYSREPRVWSGDEIEALTAFAVNASAALSGAELYQSVALEKDRNDAILSNIADGIVAIDREGNVVLWNRAAAEITGVPTEEALGLSPGDVLQRDLESPGEAPAGERLVSIRRGTEEIWLSLTEAVMRDPSGAVAGRIFAFRDISAERVVEQMKSEFVANVSRELRSPLTSIYGFAETLLRDDVLFGEEERATFLGYIASEAGRLTTIVDRLLSVARLDSGDLQVQLTVTDLGSVVRDVVRLAAQAPGVGTGGHEFVLDLPPEPLEAEADQDKLRQIVADLLENAVKYSPDGGTITVSARRADDGIEVSVDDEGIGVPESERTTIFSKFYRAETAGRDLASGGTGLGLFIAKELVEAMHGRIWMRSRPERGSSFVFVLPAAGERVASERA